MSNLLILIACHVSGAIIGFAIARMTRLLRSDRKPTKREFNDIDLSKGMCRKRVFFDE